MLHTFLLPQIPAEEQGGLITDYDENPFKADSSSAIRGSHILLREAEPAAAQT